MMDDGPLFRYVPRCASPGCDAPAVYKIAAPWSNGTSHELKNYGLACEAHHDALLAVARRHRADLALADGETVGAVGLYALVPGRRDVELCRLGDRP